MIPLLEDIKDCPRCRQRHMFIQFKPFTRLPDAYNEDGVGPFNYWAICPVKNEPLIASIYWNHGEKPEGVKLMEELYDLSEEQLCGRLATAADR